MYGLPGSLVQFGAKLATPHPQSMYAGLGVDDRPDRAGSPFPFLTLRELAQFIASREIPESFVRFCMASNPVGASADAAAPAAEAARSAAGFPPRY